MSATTTRVTLRLNRGELRPLKRAVDVAVREYESRLRDARGRGRPQRATEIQRRVECLTEFERDLEAVDRCERTGLPLITHNPSNPGHLRQELIRLYATLSPEPPNDALETARGADLSELAMLVSGWGHRA